jgi:hypothetical protein
LVELAEIQAAYYMVAATGVLVAAAYYVLNIINSNKLRRTEIVRDIIERHNGYELMKNWYHTMNIEYKEINELLEYLKRDNESWLKLSTIWAYHDRLGYLLKEGYVTPETMFNLGGYSSVFLWMKFEPLDIVWKKEYGECYEPYVKYLAFEMMRIWKAREPDLPFTEQFSKYLTN